MEQQVILAVTSTGQPMLILKEGTERSRGREAQRRNILAAKLVSEIMKSSLGPRGMDKMLVDSLGDVTITNDGAAMLKEMDIEHPVAKMMVEIAKTQDTEVGDGTTSVVVVAGSLLDKAEDLIDKDVHTTIIIDGFKEAAQKALETYKDVAIRVDPEDKGVVFQSDRKGTAGGNQVCRDLGGNPLDSRRECRARHHRHRSRFEV